MPTDRKELVASLQNLGVEVFVFGVFKDFIHEYYAQNNIKYVPIKADRININIKTDIQTIQSVRKAVKANNIDYSIIYGVRSHPAMGLGAYLGGSRILCIVNGKGNLFVGNSIKKRLLRLIAFSLLRAVYYVSHKVCFQNQDDRDLFLNKCLVHKNKTFTTKGSGINLYDFKVIPLPYEDKFVFLARITDLKGVIEYIKAAAIVKQIHPQATFTIYGELYGVSHDTKELIEEAHVKGVIQYRGRTEDVSGALTDCRYFVFPSYYPEGVPRSILQALALGRSVITTKSPGCKDTVKDGYNGFLVEPRDVEILAKKMIWMIEHPKEVELMSINSRIYAEENFNVHDINKLIIEQIDGK